MLIKDVKRYNVS